MEWKCFPRRKRVSGPVKLPRTEQVVAKQSQSPEQQNRVEGLFITAASVLNTVFQVKTGAPLSPFFYWESPHSSLALAGGPTSKKRKPSCAIPQACLWTAAEMRGYSQGGSGTGGVPTCLHGPQTKPVSLSEMEIGLFIALLI